MARRLLRYLRPYLRLLFPALFLTFALNLLGILQPKFTEYAIDWHILPRKPWGLGLLVGLYVGVQLLRLVFSYFQALLLNSVGQYVMFDMRRELYDKLQHQEVAYYDRNPVGRIMTRLTSDVDSLNELFTAGITDLLGDVVMIFAIIGVMLWMDVRLTLVTLLVIIAFLLLAAGDRFRRKMAKLAGPTLSKKKLTLQALDEIDLQVQRYMLVQVFTSALVGIATWLAFLWIGVEHAAVWGVLTFVLNFIPYLGSIIATGAAMLVGFAQFGSL